jgi:hypothetical protein
MVVELAESAQARWRAITAPNLGALVLAGARFEGGQFVERCAGGMAGKGRWSATYTANDSCSTLFGGTIGSTT